MADDTRKELDDLAYTEYLRRLVKEGIADLEAGRVISQEEVQARYPLVRGSDERFAEPSD